MENEGHLNNNGQDIGLNAGNMEEETWAVHHQNWINMEEYDMDALLGTEEHVNTDQDEDVEPHHSKEGESSKRRKGRFTVEQIQELELSFQECTHPDDEMRQEIADKIGLEARQIKFWFQNRRSQMKVKAVGDENKEIQQENNKLLADNMELQQLLGAVSCSRCRDPTDDKLRLLVENTRLNDMYLSAQENLIKLIHDANLPRSVTMECMESASLNMMPLTYNGSTDIATLLSYSKRALEEFLALAVRGEPMWLPTMNGNMLNDQEYKHHTFPGLLGPCPLGFVMEGSKETAIVRAPASSLVTILTDATNWSKMFPAIVEGVRASKILSRGSLTSRDRQIQEMNVDLWVQSPLPPIRSLKFLRICKHIGDRLWAVVDVSNDGTRGISPEGRRIGYTTCRLLPSGCLIQDIGDGYCKVTWIVHAEYDGTIVPPLFGKFFQSGQALGASRWLATLQRRCEYLAMLHLSTVPSSSTSSKIAISALGRKSVLMLVRRMVVSFYAAVSKSAILRPDNTVSEWRGSCGTAAEMFEATVHMVIRKYSAIGEPPALVLSATTTVWLQNTPPERVLEYLCNGERRGEWDTFAYAGAVQELSYITTCPMRGNAVSILHPSDVAHRTNSNMLILQETASDISCSMVVYSFVEKNMMRAIMDGVNNSPVFLLPSGFAILPDGHDEASLAAAASSSSGPSSHNHTAGSLLTASYQAMLPSSLSNSNNAAGTIDDAGNRVCNAISQILAAVGTNIAKPA